MTSTTTVATAIADRDVSRIGQLIGETPDTFTVRRTTIETLTIRKGWGVIVDLVYAGEDETNPDEPVAFDAFAVEIKPKDCTFVGGTFCVSLGHGSCIPVKNFGDNEDDLSASRYFETEAEANDHVEYVTRRLVANGLECY